MGVQVKEWKGVWWIFVNHQGQQKAKRMGEGKTGHRVALTAAEKIHARLVLGDLSLLEEVKPQVIHSRSMRSNGSPRMWPYVCSLGRLRSTERCSATIGYPSRESYHCRRSRGSGSKPSCSASSWPV